MSVKNITFSLDYEVHATLEVIAERESHSLDEQIRIFIQQGINEYQKANKLKIVPDYEEGTMVVAFEGPPPAPAPF